MNTTQNGLVRRLWSYCNILRDDGLSYGDHLQQLMDRESWLTLDAEGKGDADEGLSSATPRT